MTQRTSHAVHKSSIIFNTELTIVDVSIDSIMDGKVKDSMDGSINSRKIGSINA